MPINYLDSGYFLGKAPYMRLLKPGAGYGFIVSELKNIKGYSKFIEEYPNIKCEPLDFLYQCHESICALDEDLFDDFVSSGWRGIIWASWLAAVAPRPELYMAIKLKDNRHRAPNNQWIVEKTLLSLNDHKPDSDQMLAAIYQFKHYLSKLPYRKLPLRRWTQDIELVRCHKQKQVLSVYKTKGADAALELIKSLNTESDLNYKDWLKIQ